MTPQQQTHLWDLLGQTYGHKFNDQYGPVPTEAWSAMFLEMEPEQAKYALMKLINAGSPFPPTLPEFVALAKGMPKKQVRFDGNGQPYYGDRPVRKLPHVSEIPEDRKRAMREQMFKAVYGERLPEHIQRRLDSSDEPFVAPEVLKTVPK